ncbi:sensor histidine kinase [Brevibacterium sp. UCMA 11754]|uniref:sensor histidine kinase n=1 Tax=Brevibacterium sp. UCMA 11754 TaxID=2749198 RepID=UPI001F30C767|nr:histidine kinase [Brevibacterium sp. UCMA 11754]MCF2572358.1 sensor histidine kinase [Brevibacterium sp. UCMA 11754]
MTEHETSLAPTKGDVYIVIALAALSIVFAVLYSATGQWPFKAPLWVLFLCSILLTAPLLFRRRYPSQVAWTQAAVFVTSQILGTMEPQAAQFILFMGMYSIGAWQTNRRAAFLSRVFLCLGILIYMVFMMLSQVGAVGEMTVLQFAAASGVNLLVNVAFFGAAWLFGNRAWKQRQLMSELRTANEEVRTQERQLTSQALDLERVRIARELHDGIAHHITGVGIHAAAARRSLEKNPDKARESLKTIESSTRETVDELRALVYTLRDTDDASTGEHNTKGNPGLGDIPELIDASRRSGQKIDVVTIGEPRPLTPITEMSIYRVIQESLTNCRRYAGSHAEVDVRLRYGTTDLEVEISDTRSPGALREEAHRESEPPAKQAGLGLGIVGMRERMSALGGSLEAGPKSRGGWLVRAQIPYPRKVAEADAAAPAALETETATDTGMDTDDLPTASSITDSTAKA